MSVIKCNEHNVILVTHSHLCTWRMNTNSIQIVSTVCPKKATLWSQAIMPRIELECFSSHMSPFWVILAERIPINLQSVHENSLQWHSTHSWVIRELKHSHSNARHWCLIVKGSFCETHYIRQYLSRI